MTFVKHLIKMHKSKLKLFLDIKQKFKVVRNLEEKKCIGNIIFL